MTFLSDIARAFQNLAQPEAEAMGRQVQSPASPPARILQLFENVSVKLDGAGKGTARLTPPGARNGGLSWAVDAVAVSVETNVNESQCSVYVSYGIYQADASTLVGTTLTGSTGDTCGVEQNIRPGDWVIVQWTGGDAGKTATARITGTIYPPGTSDGS